MSIGASPAPPVAIACFSLSLIANGAVIGLRGGVFATSISRLDGFAHEIECAANGARWSWP